MLSEYSVANHSARKAILRWVSVVGTLPTALIVHPEHLSTLSVEIDQIEFIADVRFVVAVDARLPIGFVFPAMADRFELAMIALDRCHATGIFSKYDHKVIKTKN